MISEKDAFLVLDYITDPNKEFFSEIETLKTLHMHSWGCEMKCIFCGIEQLHLHWLKWETHENRNCQVRIQQIMDKVMEL